MAGFSYKVGRRYIHFSDHALDRWWERCEENELHGRKAALQLLEERLLTARWSHVMPVWTRLSWWHHARAEGFVFIDEESGFVVNKNATGDRVAVTFVSKQHAAVPA
jgi:hypothetical protein